jgi:glycerate 2-kinase
VSLIISDIVGSPLSMIASGPTVADETTSDDAGSGAVPAHKQDCASNSGNITYAVQRLCGVAASSFGFGAKTDAAGAFITSETVSQARVRGLDARAFLDNNDSYTFLEATSSLIKTGPTNTNVNDVVMLFVQFA